MDGATLFAKNNADIWNGTSLRYFGIYMSPYLDENGVESYEGQVAAGSNNNGTKNGNRYFGSASTGDTRVTIGQTKPTLYLYWMIQYNTALTTEVPFFALSDPLTLQSDVSAGTLFMLK